MNFIALILGVIVILFTYYLYLNYIKTNTLIPTTDLSVSSPVVKYTDLTNRDSTRYSFALWLYVNNWNNIVQKTIISRMGDFDLYLDTTSPNLLLNVKLNNGSNQIVNLTNNFPIQKWTYVIVSVDNQIIDFYIDGKLVLSKQLKALPMVSKNDVSMGDSNHPDITVTGLIRFTQPMDPITAWNNYLRGNGVSTSGSTYNVKLSVLKDNVTQNNYSLL